MGTGDRPTGQVARRAAGRPRDPGVEEAVLRATLRRMAADGYVRMSVDAIAAEAGVSKPTVYRRWAGKADLATAALALLRAEEPAPTGASARDDLAATLRNFQRSLLRPHGMAMIGTLLAEEAHNPELLALFRDRVVGPRRRMLREALDQAAAGGELRPGADLEAAVAMLVGAFYAAYLAADRVPDDWADRVVATVWDGIAVTSATA